MVGVCGAVGDVDVDVAHLGDIVGETGAGSWFESPQCTVFVDTHRNVDQPATAEKGAVQIWVWGDVYGYETPEGNYQARADSHPTNTVPEYCAELFEEHGRTFVEGLNSEFAVVCRDERDESVDLVTDRLGARPIYTAPLSDGLLFSTNLQALALHPAIDAEISPGPFQLYFALQHVPGLATPFGGISQLPPGARTTVDQRDGSTESNSYWRPHYQFDEATGDAVSKRLASVMPTVLTEQLAADDTVGLLLSGGSDSRLLLAAAANPPRCYHINEWENAEYRAARRVAEIAGAEFVYLQRKEGYFRTLLDAAPAERAFVSEFQQAKPGGFRDRLADEVDAVVAGMYGDTLFRGYWLPRRTFDTPIGTIDLPATRSVTDVDSYLETKAAPTPSYFETDRTTANVLSEGLSIEDGAWRFFGVEYGSLETLFLADNIYPLTNQPDYLFHSTLIQTTISHLPFLDNRVIDLHLTVSPETQLRRLLVSEAVSELQPELAAVPHPDTGVAIRRGFPVHFLADIAASLWGKLTDDSRAKAYYTDGPWRADGPFLRETTLLEEKLTEHEARLESLPYIDPSTVHELAERHQEGENFSNELFRILDVLELPVVEP